MIRYALPGMAVNLNFDNPAWLDQVLSVLQVSEQSETPRTRETDNAMVDPEYFYFLHLNHGEIALRGGPCSTSASAHRKQHGQLSLSAVITHRRGPGDGPWIQE